MAGMKTEIVGQFDEAAHRAGYELKKSKKEAIFVTTTDGN